MRRGPNRQDRPPRVGAAVLAKALVGVFLIFLSSGAGVAIAGYLMIAPPKPSVPPPPPIAGIPEDPRKGGIADVPPGGPRTLLILGSDRRAKNSTDSKLGQEPHSDTIVLVRLDPKLHRIAVLSLPRDLAVSIPGDGDGMKINQAYDEGGAALATKTVKHLFSSATGEDFVINGVIDVNFNGFQEAVNYVHGVYVDIDRRYYNPEGTGYAAIDVKAGYQRLLGSDAPAYVRYRHDDSDIYRNARQQDFLRQAAAQRSVRELKTISQATRLLEIFQKYFRFDSRFMRRQNLAGLLKTAVNLAVNHARVNQIRLTGLAESDDPVKDTRLFLSPENLQRAYDAFMTGEHATNPEPKTAAAPKPAKRKAKSTALPSGLVDAHRSGENMAVVASRRLDFPFYFPKYATRLSQYVTGTPRLYKIRDEDGISHGAYRIVVSLG